MKAETKDNIFSILYILIALVLVVIYFSVPERVPFLENQMKWWREFREFFK
ncbi:MAG: hypothetical protein HY808_12480 [Nitrospirae bacterium]|nr:hypothetical protein [Nitrospirota bacterium]